MAPAFHKAVYRPVLRANRERGGRALPLAWKFHALRHTYAGLCVAAGIPPLEIARVIGPRQGCHGIQCLRAPIRGRPHRRHERVGGDVGTVERGERGAVAGLGSGEQISSARKEPTQSRLGAHAGCKAGGHVGAFPK